MLHARWTSTIRMHASRLLVDIHGALHMSAGSPPCVYHWRQTPTCCYTCAVERHRVVRQHRVAVEVCWT